MVKHYKTMVSDTRNIMINNKYRYIYKDQKNFLTLSAEYSSYSETFYSMSALRKKFHPVYNLKTSSTIKPYLVLEE